MRHLFLFLVFLVLTGSCSRNNDATDEIPKALRDIDYSKIKISRGREELIESLYKELISDSSELKILDEKIKEFIEASKKIY